MADVVINIPNIDKVLAKLDNAPTVIQDEADKAIKKTLIMVEAAAKPLTPIDTDRLRSSYQSQFGKFSGLLKVATDYAVFVHEGTYKMKPRPFLQQGIEQQQGQIEGLWKELGDNIVNKLVWADLTQLEMPYTPA